MHASLLSVIHSFEAALPHLPTLITAILSRLRDVAYILCYSTISSCSACNLSNSLCRCIHHFKAPCHTFLTNITTLSESQHRS